MAPPLKKSIKKEILNKGEKIMSKIIGIDLGTTNSAVAVLELKAKLSQIQKVTVQHRQLCLSKTVKSSLVTQQNVKQ